MPVSSSTSTRRARRSTQEEIYCATWVAQDIRECVSGGRKACRTKIDCGQMPTPRRAITGVFGDLTTKDHRPPAWGPVVRLRFPRSSDRRLFLAPLTPKRGRGSWIAATEKRRGSCARSSTARLPPARRALRAGRTGAAGGVREHDRFQGLVPVVLDLLPSLRMTAFVHSAARFSAWRGDLGIVRFVVGVGAVKLWVTDVVPGERSIEPRHCCG
jgi:hypothetical protein